MELDQKIDRPRCYVIDKNHWHWGTPPQDSELAWPQEPEAAKQMYIEQQKAGCPFQWLWDYSK